MIALSFSLVEKIPIKKTPQNVTTLPLTHISETPVLYEDKRLKIAHNSLFYIYKQVSMYIR